MSSRIEATYLVALLVAQGPDAVLEKMIQEKSDLIKVLFQACLQMKSHLQLFQYLISSLINLSSKTDRDEFLKQYNEADGLKTMIEI